MRPSLAYAFSVWWHNAALYSRTWRVTLLPNFFEPVFYLTAIGVGVGAYITEMGGKTYIEFLAPGLLCVSAMRGSSYEVTFNAFIRMTFEKAYDSMLTTPVNTDDILIGEVLWALSRSFMYGGGFFVVAALFGLVPFPNGLLALLIIPLGGLLFSAMGIAFTMKVTSINLFSFYFTLFLTPMFLFSGVFFPIEERFPTALLPIAEALPLLHPVRLTHFAFNGTWSWIVHWDLAYILVVSAALLMWARYTIRRRLMSYRAVCTKSGRTKSGANRQSNYHSPRDPAALESTMTRFTHFDTLLAALGTLAAIVSVVVHEQVISDRRGDVMRMVEQRGALEGRILRVDNLRREAIRLRDLNTLYRLIARTNETGNDMSKMPDEAITNFEIALISMAEYDESADFDSVAFKIGELATNSRAGDPSAHDGMQTEFVRLYGTVNAAHSGAMKTQGDIDSTAQKLRDEISEYSTITTYLQVFGLILVILSTTVGQKHLERMMRARG